MDNNQNENNNTNNNYGESNVYSKLSDEEKQNVLNNYEMKEEETKYKPKDETSKAAILFIVIIALIITLFACAIKFGFLTKKSFNQELLDGVAENALSYNEVIINYMNNYDSKANEKNQEKYWVKDRYYNFQLTPSTECELKDGAWSDDICNNFYKDIENNYCRVQKCSLPSYANITLYYTNDKDGNKVGIVYKNSILEYDDVRCTFNGDKYKCEYKK